MVDVFKEFWLAVVLCKYASQILNSSGYVISIKSFLLLYNYNFLCMQLVLSLRVHFFLPNNNLGKILCIGSRTNIFENNLLHLLSRNDLVLPVPRTCSSIYIITRYILYEDHAWYIVYHYYKNNVKIAGSQVFSSSPNVRHQTEKTD